MSAAVWWRPNSRVERLADDIERFYNRLDGIVIEAA
jgi:hypothetical protein